MITSEPTSVLQIVHTITRTWSKSDLTFVASGQYDFGMIGRRIRNEFKLWDPANPLTSKWHSGESRDVQNGIDHSLGHPDNISGEILRLLRDELGAHA